MSLKMLTTLDMSDDQLIPAQREDVWQLLGDIAVLRRVIPGCNDIKEISAGTFEAFAAVNLAPIRVRFRCIIRISDVEARRSCRITGEVSGELAGFAKGIANIVLEDNEGGTLLKYNVNSQLGGQLSEFDPRTISTAARKVALQFFSNFVMISAEASARDQRKM